MGWFFLVLVTIFWFYTTSEKCIMFNYWCLLSRNFLDWNFDRICSIAKFAYAARRVPIPQKKNSSKKFKLSTYSCLLGGTLMISRQKFPKMHWEGFFLYLMMTCKNAKNEYILHFALAFSSNFYFQNWKYAPVIPPKFYLRLIAITYYNDFEVEILEKV